MRTPARAVLESDAVKSHLAINMRAHPLVSADPWARPSHLAPSTVCRYPPPTKWGCAGSARSVRLIASPTASSKPITNVRPAQAQRQRQILVIPDSLLPSSLPPGAQAPARRCSTRPNLAARPRRAPTCYSPFLTSAPLLLLFPLSLFVCSPQESSRARRPRLLAAV